MVAVNLWLTPSNDAIGLWAGLFTTVAYAPQVVRTWRTGGEGLSWIMLTLFALGVTLWFVYGIVQKSEPLILANGLTGVQVFLVMLLKFWHASKTFESRRTKED